MEDPVSVLATYYRNGDMVSFRGSELDCLVKYKTKNYWRFLAMFLVKNIKAARKYLPSKDYSHYISFLQGKILRKLLLNKMLTDMAAEGCVDGVKLLIKKRAKPSSEQCLPLRMAISRGKIGVIKLLLKYRRVDPAIDNNLPIRTAAAHGQGEVIRFLLRDSRVDPSVPNNLPLMMACRNNHPEAVKALLEDQRVDPTDRYYRYDSVIIQAVTAGAVEIVELLLSDPRVDPSVQDNLAIKTAIDREHEEIANLLLADPRVDSSYSTQNKLE